MSQPTSAGPPAVAVPARIMSFAQVAAAANKPIVKKAAAPPAQQASSTPRLVAKAVEKNLVKPANGSNDGAGSSLTPEVQLQATSNEDDVVPEITQSLDATKLDEPSTSAAGSQAGLLKKDNSDTKSVTSRTTLTLDEKDSLRPDDSASMQAAVEEDIPSPPSSVVANSKPGSDPDAQAFRDQLRQIGLTGDQRVIMPRAQRPERLSVSAQRTGGLAFQSATPAVTPPQQPEIIRPRVTDPQMWVMPPDEKLVEALASPKDRLFVLKVEQDLIDFIKDPKEDILQLPGTNSFYRMLSHKLADYYMLGHIVDDSMNSVRIFRTPGSRLPPPLIGSAPGTTGNTPPPSGPARKIMRRNGEARTPDRAQTGDATFDSLTSSKAPSDNGSGDAAKDGRPSTGNGKLTREERENRYNEARARIFKGFEGKGDKEAKDAANGTNDVGLSRSSSTSGAKRSRKQKKPKDDAFEARSAFDQFGRRIAEAQYMQPTPETPVFGQFYFDGNGQMLPTMAGFQPGSEYAMNNYGISSPNGTNMAGAQNMTMNGMQQNQYGMSSQTYSQEDYGMMSPSFEGSKYAQMINQDRTPKGTAPSLAGYNQEYMSQEWAQNGYSGSYDMANYQYPGFNPGYQQYFNGQMMQSVSPNGYGSFVPQHPGNYNQDYYGNGFQNQHFNPQSQSFVPTIPGGGHAQSYAPQQGGSVFAPNSSGYNTQHQTSHQSGPSSSQQQHHSSTHGKNSKSQNTISKWPTPASLPAKPPQPTRQENTQSLPAKPIPTR